MKNGFYHEHPEWEDVKVSPEMQGVLGTSINAEVRDARMVNGRIEAVVVHGDRSFIAVMCSFGAEHWYEIK